MRHSRLRDLPVPGHYRHVVNSGPELFDYAIRLHADLRSVRLQLFSLRAVSRVQAARQLQQPAKRHPRPARLLLFNRSPVVHDSRPHSVARIFPRLPESDSELSARFVNKIFITYLLHSQQQHDDQT